MRTPLAQPRRRAHAARTYAGALAALTVLSVSPELFASPWTLKQHEVATGLDVNFASASREFLEDGTRQRYPLQGEFISSTYSLSTRYGFTDNLEIEAALQIKSVSFDIDPVLLDDAAITQDITFEKARNNISDFADQDLGVGDLNVAMRYKVLDATYFIVTPQLGLKLPMGYRAPEGTFDDINASLANPERGILINDDVTLGDGQIDLNAGLLLGAYLPLTRTFARVDVIYNHRFGAPGDQVILRPKIGQFAWKGLLFFGGFQWVQTIFQGEAIGTTWVDLGNQQDTSTFTLAQVDPRDLFLDRSYTAIEAGVLLALDKVSLQAYVQETLSGENYADLRIFGFSAIVSVPGATAPDVIVEPSALEEVEEQEYDYESEASLEEQGVDLGVSDEGIVELPEPVSAPEVVTDPSPEAPTVEPVPITPDP